jgi:cytochrome c
LNEEDKGTTTWNFSEYKSMRINTNKHFIITWVGFLLLAGAFLLGACQREAEIPPEHLIPDGDPERGRQAFVDYGCTACHIIPGVRQGRGVIGPPLDNWGERTIIAGQFPNEAQNLISWLMAPQAMIPGSAMPDMGVTWQDAKDMSAYLFNLR